MRVSECVPIVAQVSDGDVGAEGAATAAGGRQVSGQMGCGACGRQLAPVAEVEGRAIARLVDQMHEPRRGEIQARFAAARFAHRRTPGRSLAFHQENR